MTGYLYPLYAKSLSEFGTPFELPQCGGWLPERRIPNSDLKFHPIGLANYLRIERIGMSRMIRLTPGFSRTLCKIHAGFLGRTALAIVESNLRGRLVHSKLITNFWIFESCSSRRATTL
jgi:hypothetical protein